MRLLFSGGTACNEMTLKRLLLIANEIAFMDRPSITFGDHLTIGHASMFRQCTTGTDAVRLSVHEPPSGPVTEIYKRYLEADFRNLELRRVFMEGLTRDDSFASKFIVLERKYSRAGTGADVRSSIVNDPDLLSVSLAGEAQVENFFKIQHPEGRRETLRVLLIEASIHLTNAMVVSQDAQLIPVTDDPYFVRLLAIRTSHPAYVGGTSRVAPLLGLEVVRAVIPDEVLEKLDLAEIIGYRETAKDAYEAWSVEINRLATRLDQLDVEQVEEELPRLIAAEVAPQIIECTNEMKAARDRLFGNLLKQVAKWEMPALSLAYLANLGVTGAIGAFVGALTPALPAVIDYIQAKRNIGRKHAMAYLIGLKTAQPGDK